MRVRVLYFGILKEVAGTPEEHLDLEPGSDIGALFALCAKRFPELERYSGSLLFSRNQEFACRGQLIEEGDEVALLPPVSGGAEDSALAAEQSPSEVIKNGEGTWESGALFCQITPAPIETRALVGRLQAREDGAVVVFEGVVRNHSGQRRTLFLEYDAYLPMALRQMSQICDGLRKKHVVRGIGMVHRVGRVEIGEASVVIVVTAEHRRAAFDACREAIDQLKRSVPIWKREFFEDGAVWVQGDSDGTPILGSREEV